MRSLSEQQYLWNDGKTNPFEGEKDLTQEAGAGRSQPQGDGTWGLLWNVASDGPKGAGFQEQHSLGLLGGAAS